MKKTSDYRKQAEECRESAGKTGSPERRVMLLKMADAWDSLARLRADQIAQHERIAELESKPEKEPD